MLRFEQRAHTHTHAEYVEYVIVNATRIRLGLPCAMVPRAMAQWHVLNHEAVRITANV